MERTTAGIDIGGTNTVVGIVDEQGRILGKREFKTADHPVLDDYEDRLAAEIRSLGEACGSIPSGIGIGVPNGNGLSGMAENPVNISWYGNEGERLLMVPIAERMRQRFPGVPVCLDNDANAAAMGEMIYGGAKGMKDFVEITLGTGLGSGIVVNGEIVHGFGGTAGELGHVIAIRGGRPCACGRKGCLETYVSAPGVVRTMLEVLDENSGDSQLRHVNPLRMNSQMIAEAAERGDSFAMETFERTGRILGEAIADLAAITFPEAVFLFGGLARAGELLAAPTRRHMEANLLRNLKGRVRLLLSGVDSSNAALLGAASLVYRERRRA